MLAAVNRLRSGGRLRATVRAGARQRGRYVTAYSVRRGDTAPPRIGFVVSQHSSGDSVSRHRVIRRLRHVVKAALPTVALGMDVVVRARPAATTATSVQLHEDLTSVLSVVGR